MFSNVTNSLSFSKIISGISKSLNIVKNVIPIYEDAKPIVSKVITKVKPSLITIKNKPEKKTIYKTNSPTFFR